MEENLIKIELIEMKVIKNIKIKDRGMVDVEKLEFVGK